MRSLRPALLIASLVLSLVPVNSSPTLAAGPGKSAPDPGAALRYGGLTDDESGLLWSNSSSLGSIVGRETSGPDSFAIYGGPDRPWEGRFEDGSGFPSWNGWTSEDWTDVQTYWNVDTFNAENLNGHGAGNHAMWCGQTATDQPGWATAPGYGNGWNAMLVYESDPVTDPTAGQTVSLDFYFNHDTEPGWDFLVVEYDSAGYWNEVYRIDGTNGDGSGVFTSPGVRFSDVVTGSIQYAGNDYGAVGDRIRIRIVVESDNWWSDEDGLFDSVAGAAQVDDITLTTSEGTFVEDYEGPGPYLFRPDKAPFCGDFADLYPRFTSIDPCRGNNTPVIGFLDYGQDVRNGPPCPTGSCSTGGSTSPGISYGIPGNWVTNYTGGLTQGEYTLENAIISPVIPWDLPGTDDDGVDIAGCFLRFDVWRHLPLTNGLTFKVLVRSGQAGQEMGPWNHGGWWYFGGSTYWNTSRHDLTAQLVESPDRVQIALVVEDITSWYPVPGTAGTPAPIFDNVAVYKYRLAGPQINTSIIWLPMDSFPASGSIDVSTTEARDALDIPVDMARDMNTGDTFIVPGDSLVATVRALIPGTAVQDIRMFWALKTNPLFEDAIRTAPAGPLHQNVSAGAAGTIWTGEVVADTCRWNNGDINADTYFFDLPDADFMYPGDVLQFYLQTIDSDGRITTLPSDLSGFGSFDDQYVHLGTVTGLPSIHDSSGAQPSILVLNDVDHANTNALILGSLHDLGLADQVDFDVYEKRGTGWSPNSNGIGSAGAHGANAQQLAGYSTILYFSWTRWAILLSDGSNILPNSKANDIGVLEQWHALPGTRNAAYFGDRLPQFLTNSPAGLAYLNDTMGASYEGADVVVHLGGELTPSARPIDTAFTTEFLTNYHCQLEADAGGNVGRIPHSHIDLLAPGAFYGHQYVDPQTDLIIPGAAASVVNPNPYEGVSGYDVTFPFSLAWIYPTVGRTVDLSDRTKLLRELFDLFQVETSAPATGVVPDVASFALRVAPNPFNPRTVVHFDVAAGERGSVKVFNVRGELVRTLHDGEFQTREFVWEGDDDSGNAVASGVYFFRASAAGKVKIVKAALVR